ncbi:hypothetical protein HKBW3S06_01228 [Candidatus Hakubella thermalkaliphila]|uniref:Uncharacterized protein n=3 Tax=Candidatus Hakubella thermalkaliphila TaxID=2754717 RepID=A0A6V8NNT4_9ACTN|nr:hypothetical protein HKBW3S06_01228 [Candidatus Hakubella thermalkaliphila]
MDGVWYTGLGGVAIMVVKDQILKVIQELPQDATVEDAMERLYLLYKVERGIEQAEAGQKITQEEARKRMAKWLE